MCTVIIAKAGEIEIATPRQYQEHFKALPLAYFPEAGLDMDSCFCQCDLETSLTQLGIDYNRDEMTNDFITRL